MLPINDFFTLAVAIAYLGLIFILGYTALCNCDACVAFNRRSKKDPTQASQLQKKSRHWVELILVSFALGSGLLPLFLFMVSLAGFKPTRSILIGIAIVALFIIVLLWKQKRLIKPTVPSRRHKFDALSILGFASLALIAVAACNIIAAASWPGLLDIDSFAIWMLKAKWVWFDALRPMPTVFHDPILSYSHQDYPLSIPFLVAGLWSALGHIDENAAKLLLVPTWLSLTGIIYAAVRRFHRRATALTVTAIFSTAPTLAHNAGLLVAETSLLLALAGAITQLLRWMEEGELGDLVLAGMFATFAAFTKNEGLALLPVIAIAALIVALFRRSIKQWLIAALITAIAIGPWLIYRMHLPRTHEDYGTKLLNPSAFLKNLPQLSDILKAFIGRLFDTPRVGLIWYLLIITALLSPRALGRVSVWVLWCILLIQLSLYVATFMVTPWDLQVLIPMITPKLQTQASGIAALLIALNLRDLRWPRRS